MTADAHERKEFVMIGDILNKQGDGAGEIDRPAQTRSCEIMFLLDSSGSMDEFASEAVEQFNAFLAEQRRHAQPDALMSLSLFNEDIQVITEGQSIVGFCRLSLDDYDPDGNTALVDALGKTIASGMTRHALTERPVRTLVVLLTDGRENASRKYTIPTVRSMVERARRHFGWEFLVIGVGVDASEIARDLGILPHLALSVARGPDSLRAAFQAASGASCAALRGEEIKLLAGGK
jgi:Mg-chelatase subunit ChlD